MERLDFEGRKAYVRRVECDYYTDAITYTKVRVLDTFASAGLAESGEEPANAPCIEEYLNDARTVPPPELRTEIWLPLH